MTLVTRGVGFSGEMIDPIRGIGISDVWRDYMIVSFGKYRKRPKFSDFIITRNKVEVFTNHVAFQVLKVKPRTVPICRFLPNYDHESMGASIKPQQQLFLDFGRDGVSNTKESSLMSTTFFQAD
ncbi:Homeodomain-like superfamily protein [Prunus dulcis]|uniref:Homeodomain-like superfamily protein n=1 Tax=Prunus dulcis TaxID=3755 RepID=A0A4Y1QUB7_PRUDU|nr:Homeodomain-like superfamily protein [Prunus dulcis]